MGNVARGLDDLLALDGEIMVVHEAGHWVKFDVRRVAATVQRPHGIRYSLTLHDKNNQRLLGYDNAHGITKRRVPFDHRHRNTNDEGVPYHFESAEKLVKDFWEDVDRILKDCDHS